MRLPHKMTWILACAVLGYAATPAGAQGTTNPPPNGGTTPGTGPSTVSFQAAANLTPKQQLDQANVILTQADQGRVRVQRALQQARQQRDVLKVLCLNDKLNQIDVAIRSLQERTKTMQSVYPADSGKGLDLETGRHEFTIILVLGQRVGQLITEANQCIGEDAAFTGATTTFTTVDPNQAGGDQTGFGPVGGVDTPTLPIGFGPPSVIQPPAPCSPQL